MGKTPPSLRSNIRGMSLATGMKQAGKTIAVIQKALEEELGHKWARRSIQRALQTKQQDRLIPPNPKDTPSLTSPPIGLNDDQRADWYRGQFKQCHLYGTLCTQFSPDEVRIYLEEYGRTCCQFADILTTEFFQIDDFLKHRILINRALLEIRELRDDADKTQQWLNEHPPAERESKDDQRNRVVYFARLDGIRATLQKTNERYDKLVAQRDRIYQALSATRRDRVDELRSAKDSFFTLVAAIHADETFRTQQGRYAELARMAADEVTDEWKKPVEFPDGTTEPILLDENAHEVEEDGKPDEESGGDLPDGDDGADRV